MTPNGLSGFWSHAAQTELAPWQRLCADTEDGWVILALLMKKTWRSGLSTISPCSTTKTTVEIDACSEKLL